ncbi:hypothetical protein D3C72_2071090 [compost metagenome]
MHAKAPVFGQRCRAGHADDVAPAEAGQTLGRQFDTEWAHHQGPDEGKQQPYRTCQVGVDEGQEVGVVGALDADERSGVDDGQQGAEVKLRLYRERAHTDERHGKSQHQHREVMKVR